jgi:hypothetical protein
MDGRTMDGYKDINCYQTTMTSTPADTTLHPGRREVAENGISYTLRVLIARLDAHGR